MTAEEALEILNGDKDVWRELGYESIREFNKDWDIAFDIAIKALETLDRLESIIVNQLDESTDQKECMTLRWVLDKMSEVTPNG